MLHARARLLQNTIGVNYDASRESKGVGIPDQETTFHDRAWGGTGSTPSGSQASILIRFRGTRNPLDLESMKSPHDALQT